MADVPRDSFRVVAAALAAGCSPTTTALEPDAHLLTLCPQYAGRVELAHTGNTAAFRVGVGGSNWTPLTTAHTVARYFREKFPDEDAPADAPLLTALTSALGPADPIDVESCAFELAVGETLVLSTASVARALTAKRLPPLPAYSPAIVAAWLLQQAEATEETRGPVVVATYTGV